MGLTSLIDFPPYIWITLIVAIYSLYRYSISTFGTWKNQGIPGPEPWPLVGNVLLDINKVVPQRDVERRKKYGRVYGFFDGRYPSLHVAEPTMLRDILVKSFNIFTNRRSFNMRNEDPAVQQFISLMRDEEWKRARNVLTPTFTSGKLKQMVPLIEDCIEPLTKYLGEKADNKESFELKTLLASLVSDVISTCAFGIKVDALNNPDAPFMTHARQLITNQNVAVFMLLFLLPDFVLKMFPKIRAMDNDAVQYFKKVIKDVIHERKVKNVKRPDFLQMLLDAQIEAQDPNATKNGKTPDEVTANVKRVLTPDGVVAQSMIFLLAGLETISTTVGSVCYLLAKNPEIQDRLAKEIDETIAKHDGKLTYEIIFGMEYLEMVLSESLRMIPPAARTERVASEDYKLGDIFIPKGTTVTVPIYALHMDDEFFPDPEKFDPERFNSENKSSVNQFAYLPFGAGPRNCIGMRFALMETKLILARMLHNFRFCKGPEFEETLNLRKNSFFVQPKNGFMLRAEKRRK